MHRFFYICFNILSVISLAPFESFKVEHLKMNTSLTKLYKKNLLCVMLTDLHHKYLFGLNQGGVDLVKNWRVLK